MGNHTNLNNAVGFIDPKRGTFGVRDMDMHNVKMGDVLKGLKYAGATASLQEGDGGGTKISAGRIVAGGILAGPVGAVVGGMARKNFAATSILAIQMPDGKTLTAEIPAKKRADAIVFVNTFNTLSAAA